MDEMNEKYLHKYWLGKGTSGAVKKAPFPLYVLPFGYNGNNLGIFT